ncbi:MAG: hypothetical protein QW514_02680 [Thermoprotei archaeon]
MNHKLVYAVVVGILTIFMIGLTFNLSGNPLYSAVVGGVVLLFGCLVLRVSAQT